MTSILSLTYVRDPRFADSAVQAGLTSALRRPGGRPVRAGQRAASARRSTTARSTPPASPCRACVAIQDVDLAADEAQFISATEVPRSSRTTSFRSSRWAAPASATAPAWAPISSLPGRHDPRRPQRNGGVMTDPAPRPLRDLLRRQAVEPAAGGLPRARHRPVPVADGGSASATARCARWSTASARPAAALRRSIDRLWEDQSIETCDDWVIPYIAELLDTRLVQGLDTRGQRLDVANTIYYRRRKGTLACSRRSPPTSPAGTPRWWSSSAGSAAPATGSTRRSARSARPAAS